MATKVEPEGGADRPGRRLRVGLLVLVALVALGAIALVEAWSWRAV